MRDPNYRVLLTMMAVFVLVPLYAQTPPDFDVPIDQHLHYLIVAGLAFGLYWAYKLIKSQRSRD